MTTLLLAEKSIKGSSRLSSDERRDLMLYLNPKAPAVDYHASKETLVEQAVQFALLGAGLKYEAIKRHYNPKAL